MYDAFGRFVSLSGDGDTLVVGNPGDGSFTTGVTAIRTIFGQGVELGAVYVFTRSEDTWFQQAYVKASNINEGNDFGRSISLSGDGGTLAVGGTQDESNATGINGDQYSGYLEWLWGSGAVYLY